MDVSHEFDRILLDTKEAAKILCLSRRTLEAMRVSGNGPRYVKVSGRCVRYRVRDLYEWAERKMRVSTSQRYDHAK